MENNYDPMFPDSDTADGYLSVWSRHAAFQHKPAFVWVEESCQVTGVFTYGELESLVDAMSRWLIGEASLRPGERVILLYPPGLGVISVLFACKRAGLVLIPLLPPSAAGSKRTSWKRVTEIIRETSPVAILAPGSRSPPELGSSVRWIELDPLKMKQVERTASPAHRPRPEDLYLIQYTSGATGEAKPVMISAGAAAYNARSARRAYDLSPSSVIVSWLPQYHDCGLMFLLLTVTSGSTCFLASPFSFAARPWLWIEMLSLYRASCTVVPGFSLPLLVTRKLQGRDGPLRADLSNLRALILINEPILASDVSSFRSSFSEFGLRDDCIAPSYGLAENCTFVCTAWSEGTGYTDLPVHLGLLPSGRRASPDYLHEMDVRVVDPESQTEVGDGVEGEIWVSSPSMGLGYLNNPILSTRAFQARVRDGTKQSSVHFLRTGDTGVMINTFLYVTGRLQDQLLIDNRRRLHPEMIEASAFSLSPLLRSGCSALFQEEGTGDVILVAEVTESGISDSAARAVAGSVFMEILRRHEVGVSVVALVRARTVPKTTSGKVRRSETRRLFKRGEMECVKVFSFQELLCSKEKFPRFELSWRSAALM